MRQENWYTIEFDDSRWPLVDYPYRQSFPRRWGPNPAVRSMWVENSKGTGYFRKRFSLKGDVVKSATVSICVQDDYDLYVNGNEVEPGRKKNCISFPGSTHDVSGYLRKGANVIAVEARGGVARKAFYFSLDIPGEPEEATHAGMALFPGERLSKIIALVIVVLLFVIVNKHCGIAARLRAFHKAMCDSFRRVAEKVPRALSIPAIIGFAVYCQIFLRGHSFYVKQFDDDLFPSWDTRNLIILLILLGAILFSIVVSRIGIDSSGPGRRRSVLLLILIMAVGLFFRVFRIGEMPLFYREEASFGLDALDIMNTGTYTVWNEGLAGYPAMISYIIIFFYKLFGVSSLSLKITPILFGMLGVLAIYLCASEIIGGRVALIAAFLLAVSRWNVNYSRMPWTAIMVPFFECMTFFLFLRALRTRRLNAFILSGILLGLGVYTYTAFNMVPLIIVAYVLVVSFREGLSFIRTNIRGLFAIAVCFFIVLLPMTYHITKHPESYTRRLNEVSLAPALVYFSTLTPFFSQIGRTLLMFNYRGDQWIIHNIPLKPNLDFITGIFLIIGLLVVISRIKEKPSQFLLLWFFIGVGGASMTVDAPHSTRAILLCPIAVLMAAVALSSLWAASAASMANKARWAVHVLVGLIFLAVAVCNFRDYFIVHATHRAGAPFYAARRVVEYIAGLDPNDCVLWDSQIGYHYYEQLAFATKRKREQPKGIDFSRPDLALRELHDATGQEKDVVIVCKRFFEKKADEITRGLGAKIIFPNPLDDAESIVVYRIPADVAARNFGVPDAVPHPTPSK